MSPPLGPLGPRGGGDILSGSPRYLESSPYSYFNTPLPMRQINREDVICKA